MFPPPPLSLSYMYMYISCTVYVYVCVCVSISLPSPPLQSHATAGVARWQSFRRMRRSYGWTRMMRAGWTLTTASVGGGGSVSTRLVWYIYSDWDV